MALSTHAPKVNGALWPHVTAAHPCPRCRKPDWCAVSPDGTFCRCYRVAAGGEERTDSNGQTYFLHRLIDAPPSENDHACPAPRFSVADGKGERADADTLHKIYSALLAESPLVAGHVLNLEKRGLPLPVTWRDAVDARGKNFQFAAAYPAGYRTLGKGRAAAVQSLIAAGLEELLPCVPGFFVKEKNGRRFWTIGGWGGLLIPVRDLNGRIVALLLRADPESAGPKYCYLSSKKHGGPGPNSPIHVPLHRPTVTDMVRITEGALKADIATKLSGILTIGLPGVSAWRRAAGVVREIGATTVRLAYDADALTNQAVAEALARLAEDLAATGLTVELETWLPADGKGIDDLLAAGKVPTVIVGDAVAPAIANILNTARAANPAAETESEESKRSGPRRTGEDCADPHALTRRCLARHGHADRYRLAFYRDQFWLWNGTRWIGRPDADFRGQLAAFCKEDIAAHFVATDERPYMPKVTTGLVSNVMQAISGEVLVPQDTPQPCWIGDKPARPNFIAVENGLLDIEAFLSGQAEPLRPHTPLWFSPVCLPYEFNPDARCPHWSAFLARNMEGERGDKATLLQQYAGYFLTPDTSKQRFLMLVGEGANGKSVICAVLRAMLGEDNVSSVPLELFGDKFRLAGTLGKLANIAAEVGELDRIAEGQLKAFVSGDPMEFERKFKAAFTARPTARLVLATNNPPSFSDKSDGLWRRMLLLRCNVQIPEAERIAGMDSAEWWANAGELPGILNWALAGLYALRKAGRFIVPRNCQEDADRLRVDANPARRFLEENYEAGDEAFAKSELYAAYAEWCKNHGHYSMAEVGFGREVTRRFPAVKSGKVLTATGRVNAYQGLRKRQN